MWSEPVTPMEAATAISIGVFPPPPLHRWRFPIKLQAPHLTPSQTRVAYEFDRQRPTLGRQI